MKLLVLTFYYPPDLSAGSFRNHALVQALVGRLGEGDQIDVITTMPQRYHTFRTAAPENESFGQINVRRIALTPHRSGMADQSRAFLHYARGVWSAVKGKSYDLVFASSSRLMTAALGASIARRLRVPLYLDIRDIFADTLKDVMPGWHSRFVLSGVNAMERYTLRSATRTNLVSRGFLPYFQERYPKQSFRVFSNGVDDEFLSNDFRVPPQTGRRTLLYAGNVGEGQGLHRVVAALADRIKAEWQIHVVGAGGALEKLRQQIDHNGIANVQLFPPVSRDELVGLYRSADCLFLHLNSHAAFYKVLPSKVFEYAATGKPLLAGVAGYAAQFVTDEIGNSAVFSPGDAQTGAEALVSLKLGHTDRRAFIERYRRNRIMDEMAEDIVSVL